MLEEECKRNNKQYIFFFWLFSRPTLIQLLAHTHSHQLGKPYHFLNTHYPFVLSNNAASLLLRGRECIGAHTSCMLNAKVFSLGVCVVYRSELEDAALFYRRLAALHVCTTAERLMLILAGLPEHFE